MINDSPSLAEIWVVADLRTPHFFGYSLNVLALAREIASRLSSRVAAVVMTATAPAAETTGDPDSCVLPLPAQDLLAAHGADRVYIMTDDTFATAQCQHLAPVLSRRMHAHQPKLVMVPLTDWGRELAARTAACAQVGLMADCMDIKVDGDGQLVGLCPAWGGEIVSQIVLAPEQTTGLATVQPHCRAAVKVDTPAAEMVAVTDVQGVVDNRIRLKARELDTERQQGLETAQTVVVGGAGLGNSEGFELVRELAAGLGAQVGATRPPVLQHWVAEDRMIGQTGKAVRPRLLISVGTSGAVQYTAGIAEAQTVVAVNRDPQAPIFQIADIGVVADARVFLPVLIRKARQTVMRLIADQVCGAGDKPAAANGFGAHIRKLRQGRDWSVARLAGATGQTPDFITQVEAGEVSPPVSFLLRLAAAFEIDPGTFLNRDAQTAIRDQRLNAYVRRTANYSYETLTQGREHDHLRAFMVTIEPKQAHKPVAYKHEGEEFIFVMAGDLELTLGGKARRLKAGESLHFNSDTPHKLKSVSDEATRCLVVLYTL